jgi:hypothetical protein
MGKAARRGLRTAIGASASRWRASACQSGQSVMPQPVAYDQASSQLIRRTEISRSTVNVPRRQSWAVGIGRHIGTHGQERDKLERCPRETFISCCHTSILPDIGGLRPRPVDPKELKRFAHGRIELTDFGTQVVYVEMAQVIEANDAAAVGLSSSLLVVLVAAGHVIRGHALILACASGHTRYAADARHR